MTAATVQPFRGNYSADRRRLVRRALFAVGALDAPHGHPNTYRDLACRCVPCTHAASRSNAAAERNALAVVAERSHAAQVAAVARPEGTPPGPLWEVNPAAFRRLVAACEAVVSGQARSVLDLLTPNPGDNQP